MFSTDKTERRWQIAVTILLALVVIATTVSYYDTAQEGDSAFLRWRPQILQLAQGVDVYEKFNYPNTPIVGLMLWPFAICPPVVGAMLLYTLKLIMAATAVWFAVIIARGDRYGHQYPAWSIALIILLSLRPIMSDLRHGNINILIMFIVIGGLYLIMRGRNFQGGSALGLAAVGKVTPGLFGLYFLWRREWRPLLGIGIGGAAAAILPSLVFGIKHNIMLHWSWFNQMIVPYVTETSVKYSIQINQSLAGVLSRLFMDRTGVDFPGDMGTDKINILSLDPDIASIVLRILLLAILGWLIYVCRCRFETKEDWRRACEFGIIIIGMLILSERTWKHHYTVIALPISCVVAHLVLATPKGGMRRLIKGVLWAFFALTILSSGEIIGWIYKGEAHKYVEAAGNFFWAAIALLIALSVILIRNRSSPPPENSDPKGEMG